MGCRASCSTILGLYYEPSAINEGTADYFAATLQGDPLLAEYLMSDGAAGEGALRRLDNTLRCPDDLVGEPHFDGRIWSGLGWDLRQALGAETADALMFATLTSLGTTPSLAEGGDALLATASSMATSGALDADAMSTVESAVQARGLPGCVRVVALDDGTTREGYTGDPMITGSLGGAIAPVHYEIDIPADALSLRISVTSMGGNGHYHVYGRTGRPPRFAPARRPPLVAPIDLRLDVHGHALIDRASDPPLPRCETLYLAVLTEDLSSAGASLFSVSAELERSGRDEPCGEPDAGTQTMPDAGAADAGTDAGPPLSAVYQPSGGGCSCRAGGRPGASLPALGIAAGLLGWLAARRRR